MKCFKLNFALVVVMIIVSAMMTAPQAAVAGQSPVVVFAAASTTNAVTEIGEIYAAEKMGSITPSFASSSTLAKQIASGAPVSVYISANKKWMDFLEEKDLIETKTRSDLLSNSIVLIAPKDSSITSVDIKKGFSLTDILGQDGRLSLGDPEHVPAGMYGKEALENLGSWDGVKDHLAPMKDVRAALVLVERGESPLGLVYATDAAISKKVKVVGTFPADSHKPIVYPAAVVKGDQADAGQKFMEFLASPKAKEIFQKYGFKVQ